MIRLSVFVFVILAYSTIGLVAFSYTAPTTVAKGDPNVTVVHKSNTLSVVGSPELQRCVSEGCVVGISI